MEKQGIERQRWKKRGERERSIGEKTRDNSSTEESEGKKICSGTPIVTHSYRKNQVSPLGNELDLHQGDTFVLPLVSLV